MKREVKILVIVVFVTVFSILFYKIPLFSPIGTASATEVQGCNNYQQDPQGNPPPPQEPPYGNCVIDDLVILNELEYPDVNGSYLRTEMISRMQKKGYNVPRRGLNYWGQKDAIEIKKKIMSELGYTETIGTGKGNGPSNPVPIATSPFKNNCPSLGTWISFTGGGHSSACIVFGCDSRTGAAELDCVNSHNAPITGLPNPYKVAVSSSGTITTTPASSWSNTPAAYWTQVNYPG
ncbi:MAG: hypothetical protein AABX95_04560 [Nanoarchaeota archaeon]